MRELARSCGVILLATLLAGCSDLEAGRSDAQGGDINPALQAGRDLYRTHCLTCHGPTGMGTGLLARRSETPVLEDRTDLTSDFVVVAARTGILNMPAIPRGEVSDAELTAIADYLSRSRSPP